MSDSGRAGGEEYGEGEDGWTIGGRQVVEYCPSCGLVNIEGRITGWLN